MKALLLRRLGSLESLAETARKRADMPATPSPDPARC